MQAEVDKIYSKLAIFAYTSRAAGSFGGSLLGLLGTERGTKMVSMYERERERESFTGFLIHSTQCTNLLRVYIGRRATVTVILIEIISRQCLKPHACMGLSHTAGHQL